MHRFIAIADATTLTEAGYVGEDVENILLKLAQYVFKKQFSVDYNLAFASYLLVLAPVLIVYLFCQKWIMNGVVAGAVK